MIDRTPSPRPAVDVHALREELERRGPTPADRAALRLAENNDAAEHELARYEAEVFAPAARRLAELGSNLYGRKPPPPRVVCDDATKSVWLDGKLVAGALTSGQYAFVKAVAARQGHRVTSTEIQDESKGECNTRLDRVFAKLPEKLKPLIKSGRGSGAGYYLVLPPLR